MLSRLTFLLRHFGVLLAFFLIMKVAFLLIGEHFNPLQWGAVWWHGLTLDIATAGYLTAPLWLLLLVSLFVPIPSLLLRRIYTTYAVVVGALLALIGVANQCLYAFWGFPIDGTIFTYLDSPKGAAASVSPLYLVGAALLVAAVATALVAALRRQCPRRPLENLPWRQRLAATGGAIVLGGLLFLGIRGGVGKSTANVGTAYFSQEQFLNHAAVNPAFSLLSSMAKSKDFAAQYNFFDPADGARRFADMGYNTQSIPADTLLAVEHPNVLLILMEGCGGTFVHGIDSLADARITPTLNRLCDEGVCFTQCYANSFRTDRGTICALSGYPSFPDVSVMKLPRQAATLPSIAGALRREGYATEFLYGGDINFTNTNGYLLATGYQRTYGDTSFSADERRTHAWGVTDSIVFDRLYDMVTAYPAGRPWHTAMLTLASHEPWEVPYNAFPDDKMANGMAYLDHCLGRFLDRLRQTAVWDSTLVVILPDHGIEYPAGEGHESLRRTRIPLIWTGGAIRVPRRIATLCNQTDLAATLLGQLGFRHNDFRFSRDVLSRTYTHPSAVYSWPEGLWYLDGSGQTVLNLMTKPVSISMEQPAPSATRADNAKAFLQTIYDDLGAR